MTRSLVTEPLGSGHRRSEFTCGEDTLDVYIKHYAMQDQKRRVTAILVLPDDKGRIKGYYSLSATNISSKDLPENILKKLPRHPYQPATLLGRLAVDRRDQKQRIGEILLLDALHRSYPLSEQIGSIAVIVQALNERAQNFYEQYGFIALPGQGTLFLPMKTIEQLL